MFAPLICFPSLSTWNKLIYTCRVKASVCSKHSACPFIEQHLKTLFSHLSYITIKRGLLLVISKTNTSMATSQLWARCAEMREWAEKIPRMQADVNP